MAGVCLCVTGQMRNLDRALIDLRDSIAGRDVFVIFSIWNRVGRKLDGALNLYQLNRMFDREALAAIPLQWHGAETFWPHVPMLRRRLESQGAAADEALLRERIGRLFPHAILDIEDAELLDLEFQEPRHHDRNSVRMLYKLWRANQIKKKVERRRGPFDVVVRARPDLNFSGVRWAEVVERVGAGEFLLNDWQPGGDIAGDNFAAGRSLDMDVYAALYGRAISTPLDWVYIHQDLARHLTENRLNAHQYDGVQDPIEDQRCSVGELADALQDQKAAGEVWTLLHEVALAAAGAAARLEAGEPERALELLAPLKGVVAQHPGTAPTYLYMLGQALLATGAEHAAAACFFGTRFWEREGYDPRRLRATEAIVRTSLPHMDPQAPFAPEPIAGALLKNFEVPWVAEALPRQGTTLEARLTALVEEGLAQAETQKSLTNELAAVGRYNLVIAGFDALADSMSETGADHRDAAHHIITANISRLPPEWTDDTARVVAYGVKLAHHSLYYGYMLADAFKRAGRFTEARVLQAAVLEIDPHHGGAQRQMAEICLQLRDAEAGRLHALNAVSLQDRADHRMLLAFAEFQRGEEALAEAEWAKLPAWAAASTDYMSIPGFEAFLRVVGRNGTAVPEASAAR